MKKIITICIVILMTSCNEIEGLKAGQQKLELEAAVTGKVGLKSREKAKGTFRAKYFLNHTDNSIESLFLLCDIELYEPKSVEIIIAIKK